MRSTDCVDARLGLALSRDARARPLLERAHVMGRLRLHDRRIAVADPPLARLEIARPARAVPERLPRRRLLRVPRRPNRHLRRQAAAVPLDEPVVAARRVVALEVALGVVAEVVHHTADRGPGQRVRAGRSRPVHGRGHVPVPGDVARLRRQVAVGVVVVVQRPARRHRTAQLRRRAVETAQVVVAELLLPQRPRRRPAPRRVRGAALERTVRAPRVGVVLERRHPAGRADRRRPARLRVETPRRLRAVAEGLLLDVAVGVHRAVRHQRLRRSRPRLRERLEIAPRVVAVLHLQLRRIRRRRRPAQAVVGVACDELGRPVDVGLHPLQPRIRVVRVALRERRAAVAAARQPELAVGRVVAPRRRSVRGRRPRLGRIDPLRRSAQQIVRVRRRPRPSLRSRTWPRPVYLNFTLLPSTAVPMSGFSTLARLPAASCSKLVATPSAVTVVSKPMPKTYHQATFYSEC